MVYILHLFSLFIAIGVEFLLIIRSLNSRGSGSVTLLSKYVFFDYSPRVLFFISLTIDESNGTIGVIYIYLYCSMLTRGLTGSSMLALVGVAFRVE